MPSSHTPVLSARNLSKSYMLDQTRIPIFHDLSLDVFAHDHIAIMGASGSGKSTLLTLLAGLDKPDSGSLFLGQRDLTQCEESELAHVRRTDFGFVFQSFHLIPSLSTLENVMFPLELIGTPSAQAQEEAMDMLRKVGLEHRHKSFPYQLSGGERQRTAMARALIHKPKVLFADEPTGNLDEKNSAQVLDLLSELRAATGSALIVVTHEPDIAAQADTIWVLENGKITTT